MPFLPSGLWIPTLSPKQLAVYQCDARYLFLCGPRFTAKTTASLHRIIRHAWETPDARVAMFSKTTKSGKQGVWSDIQYCLREWIAAEVADEGGNPITYTIEPKIDGATRMHYFRLSNAHGGESEIQLHSLDFDQDIESKLFNTRFSLIYFAELQNFHDRAVFDLSIQQLRMYGLPYAAHQWLSDSNPPEEGVQHFAFKIWFEERVMEEFPEYCTSEDERTMFRRRQSELRLYEFNFEDNPFIEPQQIADLKATYAHDPEAYARFVEGKWTRGHVSRRFFPGFRPESHVAGHAEGHDEEAWEYLNPAPGCTRLFLGLDTGEVNHAAAILQQRIDDKGRMCWDLLDECVSIGEELYLWDFAGELAEQMDHLEAMADRKGTMTWTTWGDSSLDKFRSTSPQTEASIVENVCGARVRLMFAHEAKAPHAVAKRIKLLQILIGEGRLLISAHCVAAINMFKEFSRRPGAPGRQLSVVARTDPHKHIFDAISYVIYSEMMEEAALAERATVSTRPVVVSSIPL